MNARMNPRSCCWAPVCALASLLISNYLFAQGQPAAPSRAATVLESMPHVRRIDPVALSPDGTQVAYIAKGDLSVIPVRGGPSDPHADGVEPGRPPKSCGPGHRQQPT